MNAQLKTMKSDFTYKVDFNYDDRQSFVNDELIPTEVCEKRGLVYYRTEHPQQPGLDDFTCISTFEGS